MPVNYYPINEDTARAAHYMVHMSDYKTNAATNDYRGAVDSAAALVEKQKNRVSSFYHEKLDGLLDTYSRRLAQWYNDYNRNQAKYPSQFISGASGYNMKKHNRQMAREESLWKEYDQIKELLHKIESVGTGPVDLSDPNARAILTEQLNKTQGALDACKAINAYYRKHNTCTGCPGLPDKAADALNKALSDGNDFRHIYNKPYPDYELSGLRGKVKRLQSRLADLDKLDAAKDEPADALTFDGGEIVQNGEMNRLQILFSGTPDEATRRALKSSGFRWSPSNKAWQRQLTQNALRDAKRIVGVS